MNHSMIKISCCLPPTFKAWNLRHVSLIYRKGNVNVQSAHSVTDIVSNLNEETRSILASAVRRRVVIPLWTLLNLGLKRKPYPRQRLYLQRGPPHLPSYSSTQKMTSVSSLGTYPRSAEQLDQYVNTAGGSMRLTAVITNPAPSPGLGSPNHQMWPRGSPQRIGNNNSNDNKSNSPKVDNQIDRKQQPSTGNSHADIPLDSQISQESMPSAMQITAESITPSQTTNQSQRGEDEVDLSGRNRTRQVINRTVNLF